LPAMAAAVGHRFRKLARTRLFTAKGPMLSGVCFLAGYDDEKQCQKGLARIAHTFNCSDVWELRHVGAANGETALKVNSRFLSNSCDHAVSTTRAMMAALWVGDKTRVSLARPAIRLAGDGVAAVGSGKFDPEGPRIKTLEHDFWLIHGDPVAKYKPGQALELPTISMLAMGLAMGTKAVGQWVDWETVVMPSCGIGNQSYQAFDAGVLKKKTWRVYWWASRIVRSLLLQLRAVHACVKDDVAALEAARSTIGAVLNFEELPLADDDDELTDAIDASSSASTVLDGVARLLGDAYAPGTVVSYADALVLVEGALERTLAPFVAARERVRSKIYGGPPGTFGGGNIQAGPSEMLKELLDCYDEELNDRAVQCERDALQLQGTERQACAQQLHDGKTLTQVIRLTPVLVAPYVRGEALGQFKLEIRPQDVWRTGIAALAPKKETYFSDLALGILATRALTLYSISGKPVDLQLMGVTPFVVQNELYMKTKCKSKDPWPLFASVGAEYYTYDEATGEWNYSGRGGDSPYFRFAARLDASKLAATQSIGVLVRNVNFVPMADGRTLHECWVDVVDDAFASKTSDTLARAQWDHELETGAEEAYDAGCRAFLEVDEAGGFVRHGVLAVGATGRDVFWKARHRAGIDDVIDDAARNGAKWHDGKWGQEKYHELFDLVLWPTGYNPPVGTVADISYALRRAHRVVHSGFVEVAIILGKAGVANAFMNQDVRAHWNAFRETSRRYKSMNVWEPKPPPSEPLPESLREYSSHFETWAAEEDEDGTLGDAPPPARARPMRAAAAAAAGNLAEQSLKTRHG
jgi:hypothetical protein